MKREIQTLCDKKESKIKEHLTTVSLKKYLNNHVMLLKNQRAVPRNKTYTSPTKYGKGVMATGDSHSKRIKRNLFDNAKSFIKSKTEHMKHYVLSSLKGKKKTFLPYI